MSALTEYAVAFTIGGALNPSFSGAMNKAQEQFEKLRKKQESLSNVKDNILKYSETRKKTLEIQNKLNASNAHYNKLQEQFSKAANKSEQKNYNEQLKDAGKRQRELAKQYAEGQNKLNNYREALGKAGIDLKNLSGEEARLQRELNKTSSEYQKAMVQQAKITRARETLKWDNLKGKILGLGAYYEGFKRPVGVASNFEQQMANVRAVTGLNRDDENFLMLEAQAREQGRLTQFSQVQVGQAQENLIRAGMNASQVIGAIPGVLAMASAEGMELAEASEIISQSLSQFEYNADQASRISNILAGASAAANTNISMMGASLQKVGTQAKSFHMSAEQAATDLAAMANTGLRGEEAGTSYQSLLTHLSKETSQQALNNLGVAVKDREGRLRRSEFLYKDLAEKLKGKGDLEINNILSGIFGDRGIRAARALMSSVQSGSYFDVQQKINDADKNNAAGKMSEIRNDTLQGKITSMQSAMEGFLERVGRPLMKALEPIVDGLTKIINLVTDLMDKFPGLTDSVILFAGAFATMKAASTIIGILGAVKDLAGGFGVLNSVMHLNPLFMTAAVGTGIIAGIWAVYNNWEECCAMLNNAWTNVCDGIVNYWDGIVKGISDAWNSFISTVSFGLLGSSEQAEAAIARQQQNAVNAMDMAWGAKEHYAEGGIISHPEIAMIGEAGPEAILPLNNPRRSFEILGQSGLLNNTSQSVKNFNIAPVINSKAGNAGHSKRIGKAGVYVNNEQNL